MSNKNNAAVEIGRGSMSQSGIGSSSNVSGSISKSSRNQQKGNNTYVKQ